MDARRGVHIRVRSTHLRARVHGGEAARRRLLRRLDVFDASILDDLGYVHQTADEAEVLFTLMAERYERRSLIITSNLVFSEWDRTFKSPMTTAAAIDRLVHHAVIIEIDRQRARRGRQEAEPEEGQEGDG